VPFKLEENQQIFRNPFRLNCQQQSAPGRVAAAASVPMSATAELTATAATAQSVNIYQRTPNLIQNHRYIFGVLKYFRRRFFVVLCG
jgi:hypothetical protein